MYCLAIMSEFFFFNFSEFAKDLEKLKLERITQVLNLAVDTVETNIDYYKALKIKFYGIDAEDDPDFDLKQFFQETSDIIEKAIHENGTYRNKKKSNQMRL